MRSLRSALFDTLGFCSSAIITVAALTACSSDGPATSSDRPDIPDAGGDPNVGTLPADAGRGDGSTANADSGADASAPPAACATTVVGPSSSGPFDLVYENGNTHVVYLATLNATPTYRERKANAPTFTSEAAFPTFGNYFDYRDVAVAMTGASLRVLLAKDTADTDIFDRSGTAFVAAAPLQGSSSAHLIRLRAIVDVDGGFSAAALFDIGGGLWFRHLTPGSASWALPNTLAPTYAHASLDLAADGSMVVAYSKSDGSVTSARRDKADLAQGTSEIAPASALAGEIATAASPSDASLLYSTKRWYVRGAGGSEQISNVAPAYGKPDLVKGADGVLRAVVYEPAGTIGVTTHLLERRGGSWTELASVSGELGRAYVTPKGGSAMLVKRHQSPPSSDDLVLVECDR